MRNIILIGMPGVGKSTLGVVLAKVLGFQFIDADLLIQKQEGKKLHEIIREKGSEGFMKIENQVNSSIITDKTVIATGGSVVYCQEAMKHLGEIGQIVYLQVSLKALERRLGNLKRRGVILKKGQTLYDISMKVYGTSEMVEEIREYNGIDEDYTIIEGQKIKLP